MRISAIPARTCIDTRTAEITYCISFDPDIGFLKMLRRRMFITRRTSAYGKFLDPLQHLCIPCDNWAFLEEGGAMFLTKKIGGLRFID